FPDQLSGGQKQRVGIARALVTNPSILLSDEATSALDPDTMESILDLLKRINRELGITIVMVTHQIRAVQKICNKVAVMQSGSVIEEGEVFRVFSNPQQQVTKDFVRTVVPDVITPSVCRQIRMESQENYEVLRLKFTGQNALGDLIYQVNTKFSLKTRILHATVTELNDQTLGILILQIIGKPEQIAEVEEYIREHEVQCEEVKCQYGL
ncbi:MAG: ATP-binding cassette domain-containing protein, partial [Acidaminococcaceae bacterium]|nr:ATP-binding cassette domain-containing protein [Acidaminococcaceae bacterium]